MWLKQRNHTCETLLVKWAEPFNAWAHFIHNHQSFLSSRNVNHGSTYQAQHLTNNHEILREAWRILMQCHPHDSICGCSIDQVADEMRPRFDQVEQIGEEITIQSLHLIAGAIDTLSFPNFIQTNNHPKITSSIVVFNPNDSIQTGLVKVNLIPAKECNSFEIIDETGKPLSYQQSGMGSRELINMILDQKGFKNALGMIHEGRAAGMVIRDFEIHRQGNQAVIEATISDSGEPDMKVWRQGLAQVEAVMADPVVDKYIIRAYSNPDICVSFIARDIPGHGYRTFWISDKTKPNSKPSTPMKIIPLAQKLLPLVTQVSRIPLFTKLFSYKKPRNAQPPYKIENEFFIVKAHATEGTLTVIDKRNNQEFSGLNRMVDGGDCGDEYNYCPPDHDIKISAKLIKVYSKQDSVHQSLEIHYQLIVPLTLSDDRKSRSREKVKISVISNITVIPRVPRIDIRTEIDNHAHDHRLRVHFPAPFDSSHSIHDGHFDIIQRSIELPNFDDSWVEPPRPEVPQRAFTCVTNGHSSLTIANRGIPEVEVLRNNLGNVELALTLLRCVGWLSRDDFPTRKGHAGPMGIATPGAQMQGKYTFDYSIIPQTADWHDSMDQAYAFNTPFRAVNSKIHSGFLPYQASMIEVQNKYFIITTTKLSEDQSSMVVRGFNSLSHPIDIVLKTWKPFIHAQLINMSEQVLDELYITPDGYVNDHVNGHEIRTFIFSY
jgi:alpha-mannosidase